MTFDAFREKLAMYVNKKLPHETDIVCVIKQLRDPTFSFDKNTKPKGLTTEDKNHQWIR